MWSEPALHLLITKLPMKTHNCALSNTCNSKSNYYIWYIWHLFQSLEPFISVISNDYGSIMAASSWERDAIQPGAFWETSPTVSVGQCNLKCHARCRIFHRNPNFLANHSGFTISFLHLVCSLFSCGEFDRSSTRRRDLDLEIAWF